MSHNLIRVLVFIGIFGLLSSPVQATPNLSSAILNSTGTERTLILPLAADNSPVISLGSAIDQATGLKVEGLAIIHRRDNQSHRPNHAGGGTTSCSGYLAKGSKWKNIEPWIMNPANTRGLDETTTFALENNGIAKWEDAADGVVNNATSVNVLGNGTQTSSALQADMSSPDNTNEVYFSSINDPGAIAVTIVWGIFGGPINQRQLVEWDQVYDDADYNWSLTGEAGKMDFDNIATHEIGHSVGLADLYNTCTNETMYGYADNGETKKRDLNSGDINGINQLY